jgi:hypothetical protein
VTLISDCTEQRGHDETLPMTALQWEISMVHAATSHRSWWSKRSIAYHHVLQVDFSRVRAGWAMVPPPLVQGAINPKDQGPVRIQA